MERTDRKRRYAKQGPRLEAALGLLGTAGTLADIGCDHGRFGAEALRRGQCERVIASDISAPSLEKARSLAEKLGLSDRFGFYVSSGLSHLSPGDADSAAILGMGGELIVSILEADPVTARSLARIVMQPMRGETELRRYLYDNGYRIIDETVVKERGRFYQLICARHCKEGASPLPAGWPEDYYQFGPAAVMKKERFAYEMIARYLGIIEAKLKGSLKNGSAPAALLKERDACRKILEQYYPEKNGENLWN